MIAEIDQQLGRWAEWIMRSEGGGLGFPRESAYTRLQARSGGGYCPEIDNEAWQTEQVICELRQSEPLLHEVIVVMYLKTLSNDQRCRACACSIRTFYDRLHRAHIAIDWANRHQLSKTA